MAFYSFLFFLVLNRCLLDSKLQPSKSRFLVRTQDDKLQLVIDAFRFSDDDRGEVIRPTFEIHLVFFFFFK